MSEVDSSQCVECERGTYKSETGPDPCTPCSGGGGMFELRYTTEEEGATSEAACVGKPGLF